MCRTLSSWKTRSRPGSPSAAPVTTAGAASRAVAACAGRAPSSAVPRSKNSANRLASSPSCCSESAPGAMPGRLGATFAVAGTFDIRLGVRARGFRASSSYGRWNTFRQLVMWAPKGDVADDDETGERESSETFAAVQYNRSDGFGERRGGQSASGIVQTRFGKDGQPWRHRLTSVLYGARSDLAEGWLIKGPLAEMITEKARSGRPARDHRLACRHAVADGDRHLAPLGKVDVVAQYTAHVRHERADIPAPDVALDDHPALGPLALDRRWPLVYRDLGDRGERYLGPRAGIDQDLVNPLRRTPGVFTEAQAKRGQAVYPGPCGWCHGRRLNGAPDDPDAAPTPPLARAKFLRNWYGKSLAALFVYTKATMPESNPGALTDQEYTDIIAYMLSVSGMPAGNRELPADPQELAHTLIQPKPSGSP